MKNLIFTAFQHFLRKFRSLKWAKISISLLAIPACVFTFVFARADELPPGCIHPYDKPTHVRCTYTFTGSEQIFQVPAGVTLLDITAIGAAGAAGLVMEGSQPGAGGKGGLVQGLVTVTPSSALYVKVGGTPTTDPSKCRNQALCMGGWNGGGSGGILNYPMGMGGGGGGASDVRVFLDSLDSRLIVAGGGGGGGSSCNDAFCHSNGGNGGNGGDAGSPGLNGQNVPSAYGGTGGGAGTLSIGGAGGMQDGNVGSSGQGGNGGIQYDTGAYGMGAGGGGGYYGGGGGGVPESLQSAGPGGGGGGSSFVPASGGTTSVTTEPASVRIQYIVP